MVPIKTIFLFFPLAFLFMTSLLITSVGSNPIPVYPDPEPVIIGGSGAVTTINPVWLFLIFVVDFNINILIVYIGIYLLSLGKTLGSPLDLFRFSRWAVLLAILLISVIGIVVELLFGSWMGGLPLALLFIVISFIGISFYLLRLSWRNSVRMGVFALFINILTWTVIFSI